MSADTYVDDPTPAVAPRLLHTALHRIPEPTAEQRRAAALTVAAHSRDADDCRELLSMLGLLPAP